MRWKPTANYRHIFGLSGLFVGCYLSLFGLFLAVSPSGLARAGGGLALYFPQTGYSLAGEFLDYWQREGGLRSFGYPISESRLESNPQTGHSYQTQWFERARFELHPENAGTPYEVQLGLLGKEINQRWLATDPHFSRAAPLPDEIYFQASGHNLGGKFLEYWRQQGGLVRWGYPISDEHFERDPHTGKLIFTQWFERGRFELHLENQPPYNVLPGLVGQQLYLTKQGYLG